MNPKLDEFELAMTSRQWDLVEDHFDRIRQDSKCGMIAIQPVLVRGSIKITVFTKEFSDAFCEFIQTYKDKPCNPDPSPVS